MQRSTPPPEFVIVLESPAALLTHSEVHAGPRQLGDRLTALPGSTPWPAFPDLLVSARDEFLGLVYGVPAVYREPVRRLCAALDSRVVEYREEEGDAFVYCTWGAVEVSRYVAAQAMEVDWYFVAADAASGSDLSDGLPAALRPVAIRIEWAELLELHDLRPPSSFILPVSDVRRI